MGDRRSWFGECPDCTVQHVVRAVPGNDAIGSDASQPGDAVLERSAIHIRVLLDTRVDTGMEGGRSGGRRTPQVCVLGEVCLDDVARCVTGDIRKIGASKLVGRAADHGTYCTASPAPWMQPIVVKGGQDLHSSPIVNNFT